jgi:hypothetical protein
VEKLNFIRKVTVTIGTLFIVSLVNAENVTKIKYVYEGDKSAVKVCKSIMKDDVTRLRKALRNKKTNTRSLISVDRYFRCNDMDLYVFSVEMDADQSQQYLLKLDRRRGFYKQKGRVTIEEIVSL